MNNYYRLELKYIIIVIITLIFSISAAASASYFKTEEPRNVLLKVREAESALREAEARTLSAEKDYKLINNQAISKNMELLQKSYNEMTAAYESKDDERVKQLSERIVQLTAEINYLAVESKPAQLRAFWLDSRTISRLGNRKAVSDFLDKAEEANFNLILPEVFFKGLSIIPNNNYFRQDSRFKDWEEDPLKVIIEEAHKRDMEVHAWVWVFNENTEGKPGRILQQNPGWANKNKAGEILTYHNSSWLSPSIEKVRKYLQARYLYLVKNYELDGINLDYIRFPEEYRGSFGYDEHTVSLFKEQTGLNAFNIENNNQAQAEWNSFRENLITEMVRETSDLLREADPDIMLSADVIPGIDEARYRALQNWKHWLEQDYLDFVLPMTYTENLFSELKNWLGIDRQKLSKAIYAGISVFKLSQKQMLAQIEEVNKINPNGFSLFAAAHLKEEDFELLSRGYLRSEAVLIHRDQKEALNAVINMNDSRLKLMRDAGSLDQEEIEVIKNYRSGLTLKNLNKFAEVYESAERADIMETDRNSEKDEVLAKDKALYFHFIDYLAAKNINISEKNAEILHEDFSYLLDIKRLYN